MLHPNSVEKSVKYMILFTILIDGTDNVTIQEEKKP
jgi:hypothetical protein